MNTTEEIKKALTGLKAQHKNNWLAFNEKLNGILPIVGARNIETDISEDITAEAIVDAGFSSAEAEALLFVFTEECMGQSVNNLEMVERWFCYSA